MCEGVFENRRLAPFIVLKLNQHVWKVVHFCVSNTGLVGERGIVSLRKCDCKQAPWLRGGLSWCSSYPESGGLHYCALRGWTVPWWETRRQWENDTLQALTEGSQFWSESSIRIRSFCTQSWNKEWAPLKSLFNFPHSSNQNQVLNETNESGGLYFKKVQKGFCCRALLTGRGKNFASWDLLASPTAAASLL